SLRKSENYRYIDEDEKVKDLPSKVTINAASDNKTVTLEFPDAYKNDSKIKGIVVKAAVKDLAGNQMEADYTDIEMDSEFNVKAKETSMKVNRVGDDVEVELVFDAAIDKVVDNNKFEFTKVDEDDKVDGKTEKVNPNSVKIDGEKIKFKFTDKSGNAAKIRSFGSDLVVKFEKGAAIDKSGVGVLGTSSKEDDEFIYKNEYIKVYDNYIAPELDMDEENGYITNWKADIDESSITIKFDAQIEDMGKAYDDDFDFITTRANADGKSGKIDVQKAEVISDTEIKFTFAADSLKNIESVNVKANKDKVDVRTKKDRAGNYKEYKPEDKDISGRKFKISVAENNTAEEQAAKDLETAKTAYNEALTAAKDASVDVETHKVSDVEKATKAELEKATTAINEAVKVAKEAAEKLEEAKQAFVDLKGTVIGLDNTEAGQTFKIKIGEAEAVEFTIVADETEATAVEKDKAYAKVTQASAIKTAMDATASEETVEKYEGLTNTLREAIEVVSNQKGTKVGV
ncbi:hypothetical protein AAGC89_17650, partial [Proteus mirabilis]|uniref:hypothetical protein n=1 Tax=Proteus mirabilis TaxID=584 RepID=UPI00318DAFDD